MMVLTVSPLALNVCMVLLYTLLCATALPLGSSYRVATAAVGRDGTYRDPPIGRDPTYRDPLAINRESDESRALSAAVVAANEPTCEQLRVMWRFSKRQSRAAEITNELPTYRDPLAYNVWDAYATYRDPLSYARTRSGGGRRRAMVFGRVVHDARGTVPSSYEALLAASPDRLRAFQEVTRLYGGDQSNDGRAASPPAPPTPTRKTLFRGASAQPMPVSSGQFQHLKELIRSERARELLEQRMKEEAVARAEALKDIVNQVHFGRIVQHQKGQLEQAVADRAAISEQQQHPIGQIHSIRSQLMHKRTPRYPFIIDYYDDLQDEEDIDDEIDPFIPWD
ncbi:uncharacterized protein LOC111058064 [Nilaparvata lugens]|uniref:uncharacterized protein LOC111058064 n=1 Tax=Nilaparvata lugens TaxID=108931 RepID=UPI00193E4DC5|nr:uncharacterized protein LOC111058064 [Nilaparvata lugens]